MLGALDEIERRIEKFRDTAFQLEQEKEDLLGALQMVQDNKELLTLNQCNFSSLIIIQSVIIRIKSGLRYILPEIKSWK